MCNQVQYNWVGLGWKWMSAGSESNDKKWFLNKTGSNSVYGIVESRVDCIPMQNTIVVDKWNVDPIYHHNLLFSVWVLSSCRLLHSPGYVIISEERRCHFFSPALGLLCATNWRKQTFELCKEPSSHRLAWNGWHQKLHGPNEKRQHQHNKMWQKE